MSLNNKATALLLALSVWPIHTALAAEACPVRARQPLRFVDVFDGPAKDQATLVPDKAGTRSGFWLLDYVYDAHRFVVIHCKYADNQMLEVKLPKRVHRCDYKIDAKKTLNLCCK
jgi:hypothetical protein